MPHGAVKAGVRGCAESRGGSTLRSLPLDAMRRQTVSMEVHCMHECGRRRNVAYQSHLLVFDPTSADMDSLQQLSSISDSSIRRVIIPP